MFCDFQKNDHIAIVGLKSDVEGVRKKVEGYLHENTVQTFFLRATYGKAQFIVVYSEEFSKSACSRKNLACSLTPESGGGIILEGKRAVLTGGKSFIYDAKRKTQVNDLLLWVFSSSAARDSGKEYYRVSDIFE